MNVLAAPTDQPHRVADPDKPSPSTDPLDIEAFRRNGHALIDWVSDYYTRLGSMAVYEPVEPGAVRAQLPARAPEQPEPFEAVLADLDEVVTPALAHWQHPGWLAYFPAGSSPAAVLGELAAAGLAVESMMWSTSPAATEVESLVVDWLVDLLNLPQEWKTTARGGGVMLSGASSATHTALVVARDQCRKRTARLSMRRWPMPPARPTPRSRRTPGWPATITSDCWTPILISR